MSIRQTTSRYLQWKAAERNFKRNISLVLLFATLPVNDYRSVQYPYPSAEFSNFYPHRRRAVIGRCTFHHAAKQFFTMGNQPLNFPTFVDPLSNPHALKRRRYVGCLCMIVC